MSQQTEDARVARIQKYKEERRRQLTARTAVLFSNNVTDRKRRATDRSASVDTNHLKSSSEVNLTTSPPSVAIRSTRASRLRAAATTPLDSIFPPKKIDSSSITVSLHSDDSSKSRPCRLRAAASTPHESISPSKKIESISTTVPLNDDDGCKTKPRRSLELRTPERDKVKANVKPKSSSPKVVAEKENLDKKEPVVNDDVALLDVIPVERVERFSELLINTSLPNDDDAELLFEDILAENGIPEAVDATVAPSSGLARRSTGADRT